MTTPSRTDVTNGMRFDASSIKVVNSRISTIDTRQKISDTVVFAGFFDIPINMYDFYDVSTVEQMLFDMTGNLNDVDAVLKAKDSEIYHAVLACKLNGGDNITLFKLGELSELDDLEDDEKYQLVYDRLHDGIDIAVDLDGVSFFVPVDALGEGYTKLDGTFLDFLDLCATACAEAMSNGLFVESLLSTATSDGTVLLNSESIRRKEDWQFRDPEKSFCYSPTIGWIPGNDKFRFVAVPTGRALIGSYEYGAFFEQGLAPAVAGRLSSLAPDVSLTGRVLNVSRILNPVYGSMADELSIAGYMPIGQNALMRRGKKEGAIVLGDNTMAIHASDYQQEVILRLARKVSSKVSEALDPYIGTSGIGMESAIEAALDEYKTKRYIRSYQYWIGRNATDPSMLKLFVEVRSYLTVKAIEISLVTGPFVK